MGHRCCSKQKVKRGLWSPEEDEKLIKCITSHGHGSWSSVPKLAGLQRCGKSCRLRWINYLRPDLKRGTFTAEEEQVILDVHRILGNRWAQIAKHLPGRTDNEVKNFWNSCIKKKLISQGLDPKTHNLISSHHRPVTSNNSTVASNNLPKSHHQPISFLTEDVSMGVRPPNFVTLPPLCSVSLPPLSQHQTMEISTSEYQNSTLFWGNVIDQHSHDNTSLPSGSPMESTHLLCSSSSYSVNPSGFGLLGENCIWDGSAEAPRVVLGNPQQQKEAAQQQIEMSAFEVETNKSEYNEQVKGGGDNIMDTTSLYNATFDLEFMESALMSATMRRDLSSMDDFSWTF